MRAYERHAYVWQPVAGVLAALLLDACGPAYGAPSAYDALVESVIAGVLHPERARVDKAVRARKVTVAPSESNPFRPPPVAEDSERNPFRSPFVEETSAPNSTLEAPLPGVGVVRSAPSSVPRTSVSRGDSKTTNEGMGAGSPIFPEGIEYSIQGERSFQRISNPYRLPDTAGSQRHSDMAVANEVRAAVIVPLASERTRLLASAAFGDVEYQDQSKLDYQPHYLRTILQWRASDLFEGSVSASDRVRLNRYLATSWPDRDLVKQKEFGADVGLRVTESLTVPMFSVSRLTSRNEFAANQALYNRNDTRFRVAGRYAGTDKSYFMAGLTTVRSNYPDRTPLQVQELDQRYTDREYFVNGAWHYSAKTAFEGYVGWRQRSYAFLGTRDVNFITADLRALWDYSAKTSFRAHLWHRPYGNEEDPSILYSTLTGGRLTVRWQASEKSWLSLNVVRERQKNTNISVSKVSETIAWRVGPRIEWQVHPNILLTLDGWRERVSGEGAPSYGASVIRVGMTLSHDNGSPWPARQYRHGECDTPRYLDTRLCDQ